MQGLSAAILILFTATALAQRSKEQRDPCEERSKIAPDADYCDRYRECDGGQAYVVDCPNGLVYAGKGRGVSDNCDYPWRVNSCGDKPLANPPISTEHCDWLYGIFGHETSCTRYWTCWNGTAVEQFCIGGLLYNEETHGCDWPENVQGCQKHPLCKDDANGKVPLGKSCERYWSCQGGYPRLQRCSATLVFDKKSRRCVNPPTEDCEVPTTQPPPPEEEEDQDDRRVSRPRPSGQTSRRRPQQQRRPVVEQDPRPDQQSFRPRPQEEAQPFRPRPQEEPQSFRPRPQESQSFRPLPQEEPQFQPLPQEVPQSLAVEEAVEEERAPPPQPLRPVPQRRPIRPLNPVPPRQRGTPQRIAPQRPSSQQGFPPRVRGGQSPRPPFPAIPSGAIPIVGRPARPGN